MWKLLKACSSFNPHDRPSTRDISLRLGAMAKKWNPQTPLSPNSATQVSRSTSHSASLTSQSHIAEHSLPEPEKSIAQLQDIPPFKLQRSLVRKQATIMFTDKGLPILKSHDQEYQCYPQDATFISNNGSSFSAYVTYGNKVYEETWELAGPSITRSGPGVDMLWRFPGEDVAQKWFNALRQFTQRKKLKNSIASVFRSRPTRRCPESTVELRISLTQWHRVVEGEIMNASWDTTAAQYAPPDPMWNYFRLPRSCNWPGPVDMAMDAFSYIEEFDVIASIFWKISLNGNIMRCETHEQARGWFYAFRRAIQSIRSPPPLTISHIPEHRSITPEPIILRPPPPQPIIVHESPSTPSPPRSRSITPEPIIIRPPPPRPIIAHEPPSTPSPPRSRSITPEPIVPRLSPPRPVTVPEPSSPTPSFVPSGMHSSRYPVIVPLQRRPSFSIEIPPPHSPSTIQRLAEMHASRPILASPDEVPRWSI
ncbi:hypothetical protein OBBRIDRAFT_216793 [Obba rivulosa]|uniref:Uncharacterized protein n=1 Tax=Obba rivulosa TaxID=1052685 RepID=A0A8E2DQN6_9APHY|nr:hypothetical protein OBBRIDRAFT_216793 [Obba rivulosa]